MHCHKLAAYYKAIRYKRSSDEPRIEAARRACALIESEFTVNETDTNAVCAFMKMIMLEYRDSVYTALVEENRISWAVTYNPAIQVVRDLIVHNGTYCDSKRTPVVLSPNQCILRDIVTRTDHATPTNSYAHMFMTSFDIPSNIESAVNKEMFQFINKPQHYDELKKKK